MRFYEEILDVTTDRVYIVIDFKRSGLEAIDINVMDYNYQLSRTMNTFFTQEEELFNDQIQELLDFYLENLSENKWDTYNSVVIKKYNLEDQKIFSEQTMYSETYQLINRDYSVRAEWDVEKEMYHAKVILLIDLRKVDGGEQNVL